MIPPSSGKTNDPHALLGHGGEQLRAQQAPTRHELRVGVVGLDDEEGLRKDSFLGLVELRIVEGVHLGQKRFQIRARETYS